MPAYILIKAFVNPGATIYDMTHQRGFPVTCQPVDQYHGKQVMPDFVQLVITDKTPEEVRHYCDTWNRVVLFSIVNYSAPLDGYRIRAVCDPVLVSAITKMNALTRAQIESFLNKWNATVFSTAENEVVFDAGIYNALTSSGFWSTPDVVLQNFTFNEDNYDEGTGLHTITVTYPLSVSKNVVVSHIVNNLGLTAITGVNDGARQITFDASSVDVRVRFFADVKRATDRPVFRKKWMLTESAMQLIEAAGGSLEATAAQVLTYLHNRLDD